MIRITEESFFASTHRKIFNRRINHEIFERIFPHHRGEKDYGYSFASRREMNARTEELEVQGLLDDLQDLISRMPEAYGESFRHIMHRDLHARLRLYEQVARKRVQPRECDPSLIATHA